MPSRMDRAAAYLLTLYPKGRWGLDESAMLRLLVQQLGPWGAAKWMAKNGGFLERAVKQYGGLHANLVFALASLLNGCAFCLFAHARAFELYYFQKYDKLFPMDQHEILSLIPLTDQESRLKLESVLREAGLEDEVEMFRRLYAIKLEGSEPRPGEEYLVRAIELYDMVNYCALEGQFEIDGAHDAINRDGDLITRFAAARLAAGRRKVLVDDITRVEEAARHSDSTPNAPGTSDR